MNNNPFEPSKAEISARTAAKFLVDIPTGDLPGILRQIPGPALGKIATSLESYAIRTCLITAYVQAIALGYSREDAAGKSATISRAVRKALHAIADDAAEAGATTTARPKEEATKKKMNVEGRRSAG